MKTFTKAMLGAGVALTLTAGTASAAVVCNEEGDCWRVEGEPRYEPSLKLRIQRMIGNGRKARGIAGANAAVVTATGAKAFGLKFAKRNVEREALAYLVRRFFVLSPLQSRSSGFCNRQDALHQNFGFLSHRAALSSPPSVRLPAGRVVPRLPVSSAARREHHRQGLSTL
jgi:hypothetical protein